MDSCIDIVWMVNWRISQSEQMDEKKKKKKHRMTESY